MRGAPAFGGGPTGLVAGGEKDVGGVTVFG
jgi:hypothetical protein